MGKAELARRFGVSRRTVYHWIETAQLDQDLDDEAVSYKPRPAVSRKLDPFKGVIEARLQIYSRRSERTAMPAATRSSSSMFAVFVRGNSTMRCNDLRRRPAFWCGLLDIDVLLRCSRSFWLRPSLARSNHLRCPEFCRDH